MLTWPDTLPYKAERDAYKIPNLGLPLITSQMGSGKTRMRKQFTLRITGVQTTIILSPAKLAIFRQFLIDLGDGAAEFTMPVWVQTAQAYQNRTVQIRGGANGVAEEGHGLTDTKVSFILDVRNL